MNLVKIIQNAIRSKNNIVSQEEPEIPERTDKRVIIFFDRQNSKNDFVNYLDAIFYCENHHFEMIDNIDECLGHEDYKSLLHSVKEHQARGKVTVIIPKDTYEAQENLMSCAIIAALNDLELIDVYVCSYTKNSNNNSNEINISLYNECDNMKLINKSVMLSNSLTGRNDEF